jgi:hypothetical protein
MVAVNETSLGERETGAGGIAVPCLTPSHKVGYKKVMRGLAKKRGDASKCVWCPAECPPAMNAFTGGHPHDGK